VGAVSLPGSVQEQSITGHGDTFKRITITSKPAARRSREKTLG
jgi:hypothetical protein